MTREDYIRLAGWVALAAAVLIAVLIPVTFCVSGFFGEDASCGSVSFWRAITGDFPSVAINYRWPIRVGVIALGVVAVIAAHAVTAPGRDEAAQE